MKIKVQTFVAKHQISTEKKRINCALYEKVSSMHIKQLHNVKGIYISVICYTSQQSAQMCIVNMYIL